MNEKREEIRHTVSGCALGKHRNEHHCYKGDCINCGWYEAERKRRQALLRNTGLRERPSGIRFLAVMSAD